MNRDLELAIQMFRAAAPRVRRYMRYYSGEHDLSFATEKFESAFGSMFREFAMNLCPAIVDAVKDKLKVEGFGIGDVGLRNEERKLATNYTNGTKAEEERTTPPYRAPLLRKEGSREPAEETELATNYTNYTNEIELAVERIWRGNRMAIRAGEIHKEALKCGDAYAVVWFDPAGEVTIYPQRADRMAVKYDDEIPGRMEWAAKWWPTDDKRVRLNIYYSDRVERYVSKGDQWSGGIPDFQGFVPLLATEHTELTEKQLSTKYAKGHEGTLRQTKAGGTPAAPVIPNPYGVVPVFHFANNSDVGSFGESELVSAIPIQDGMNKSILDMLVAMEYSAFRQRWIAGMEVEKDPETGKAIAPFQHGVERLWVANSTDTRFGDFNTSDLEQFLKVKDGFRIDMASVTGTPLYYLMPQIRGFPSGESLRKAETRFLAKVRDRQEQFGAVWADLMSFALRLAGFADASLTTQWEDPSPREEREVLENLSLKLSLGVPAEQVLREAGY